MCPAQYRSSFYPVRDARTTPCSLASYSDGCLPHLTWLLPCRRPRPFRSLTQRLRRTKHRSSTGLLIPLLFFLLCTTFDIFDYPSIAALRGILPTSHRHTHSRNRPCVAPPPCFSKCGCSWQPSPVWASVGSITLSSPYDEILTRLQAVLYRLTPPRRMPATLPTLTRTVPPAFPRMDL